MAKRATVLSYAACGTCKKALRWLADHGVEVTVRPIVDAPPTAAELASWIPRSGKPVRKWLNTSGQSYRALCSPSHAGTQPRAVGKAAVDAMSDAELVEALAADGKLVKRPVVVAGTTVLVGFDEAAYEAAFG